MAVYIFLLIYTILFGSVLYFNPGNKKVKKLFCIFTFGMMSLILGLRSPTVGEDTQHYINMFAYAKNVPWSNIISSNNGFRTTWMIDQFGFHEMVENGWLALCKIVQFFTDNGQVFIFLVAILTCGLFAKFVYDNSSDIIFSTLIFLCESEFMFAFNGIRQSLAIAISLQAYTSLKNKKLKTAIFWILIAFLIHNTSLIMLLIFPYMLLNSEDNYKYFKYSIVVGILLPISVIIFKNQIIHFLPSYTGYFLQNYWNSNIGGSTILWGIEFMLIVLMYWKKFKINDSYLYASFILIYLSCEIAGLNLVLFSRLAYYFRAFLILFFPNALEFFAKKNRLLVKLIISILIILLYFSYASTQARQYSFCFAI